jgi:hypothetical protein
LIGGKRNANATLETEGQRSTKRHCVQINVSRRVSGFHQSRKDA